MPLITNEERRDESQKSYTFVEIETTQDEPSRSWESVGVYVITEDRIVASAIRRATETLLADLQRFEPPIIATEDEITFEPRSTTAFGVSYFRRNAIPTEFVPDDYVQERTTWSQDDLLEV